MSKKILIAAIANDVGLTRAQAAAAVTTVQVYLAEEMALNNSATLPGIGTFKVTIRAARTGRNPLTGAKLQIPAKKHIKFVAAKNLKEVL